MSYSYPLLIAPTTGYRKGKMLNFRKSPELKGAQFILDRLGSAGHRALLAGGCVRDALLGQSPKDFDIATEARPEQIEALFEKVIGVGRSFGVMVVVIDSRPFEVATFRTDGDYFDGRRPMHVSFSGEKEDALRRDFTVNALFYDLKKDQLIDYVGGEADLKKKMIRAVGDPRKRFNEDHLRILRALRFSSQLGFTLESETFKALVELRGTLRNVSRERVTSELEKLLAGVDYASSLEVISESQIFEEIFYKASQREVSVLRSHSSVDYKEQKYVETDPLMIWIRLFKTLVGNAQLFDRLATELTLSKKMNQGLHYLLHHVSDLFKASLRQGVKVKLIGDVDFGLQLMQFATSQASSAAQKQTLGEVIEAYQKVMATDGRLPAPLLTGEDLKTIGIAAGEQMGRILKEVYLEQLEERFKDRSSALEWVKAVYTSNEGGGRASE